MKIDELLKRLENIKIDNNKIDEKHEIIKTLAQTFGDEKVIHHSNNFMMKDKTVYGYNKYVDLLRSNKISPNDAYVYVGSTNNYGTYSAVYFYPFLTDISILKNAYLSKLDFGPSDTSYYAPARGLKYIATANTFEDARRVVIEVTDLATVIVNTNLPMSVHDFDEVREIMYKFLSRKLFAGYNSEEAIKIIRKYYRDNDTLLIKDVETIRDAYEDIFKPYRAIYDIKTKRFILTYPRYPIESTLNTSFGKSRNLKIGETFKRLENVEIDERHAIAEYLAQKLSINDSQGKHYHIMTKDKTIYDTDSYRKLLESNRISPGDVNVYILTCDVHHITSYYLPFLVDNFLLVYAYLSKQGLDYHNAVPATGLKYVAVVTRSLYFNRLVVEVTDIDGIISNTNLSKLIPDILLNTGYIDNYKVEEIITQLESQRLFNGHTFNVAWDLSNWHYDHGDKTMSIVEKVESIKDAYNLIFKPYRVVYDLDTKQFQVSGNNEDR